MSWRFLFSIPFLAGCGQPEPCQNPPTWSGIYVDYLGPSSKGTCSGGAGDSTNCHLDATSVGSMASKGFVCGTTKESCYASFKTLIPPGEGKPHYFEAVLRQNPSSGCLCSPMPLRPATSTFTACDLDRIRKWADQGAPDN